MKPFERPIINLNVRSIRPIYGNSSTPTGVTQHWIHNVVEAHAPGNVEMEYTILDEDGLVRGQGVQELSIRTVTDQELEHLKSMPTTSSWYNPNLQVYKTQYPLDVEAYFREHDWRKKLRLWITEGLDKDERLVDCYKSLVIPIQGNPTLVQPLNAHAILILITSSGKTYIAYLFGEEPIVNPTVAGAIGSYDQRRDGAVVKKGFLNGEGFPIILDEINTEDKPLIQKLLAYLETGIVARGLKEKIVLRGTRTVILNGNPTEDDMICSLVAFLRVVCTVDHPQRVGRRFGYLLIGNDYRRVQGDGDPSVREEVRRVIETVLHQFKGKLQRMVQNNMDWINTREPDIEKEILGYAEAIPNKVASDFVRGQSYGCIRKLKMAAIRYIILEQLNHVPNGTVDFSDRDSVFQKLMEINRDSWKKLAVFKIDDKKRYALEMKAKMSKLSNRQIAGIVGVSHTTVNEWLKEGE